MDAQNYTNITMKNMQKQGTGNGKRHEMDWDQIKLGKSSWNEVNNYVA
jgi:hypothetical protein